MLRLVGCGERAAPKRRPRYLDEDGDACTLCEASLSDFLAQAANGVDMANSTGKMVLRLELVSLPQAAQAPALPEALPPMEAPEASPKDMAQAFEVVNSPSDGLHAKGTGCKGKGKSGKGKAGWKGRCHNERQHAENEDRIVLLPQKNTVVRSYHAGSGPCL